MKRTLIASLIAAAFVAPVQASPATFVEELLGGILPALDETRWSEDFAQDLRANLTTMYGPRLGSSRVVKGAPYSAEVVTESRQALADGNEITHRTLGAVHRGGEGRTRQESGLEGKKQKAIYINDPVDSKYIVLMPDSKRAIVKPQTFAFARTGDVKDRQVFRIDSKEIRIENGKVFLDGKEVTGGKVELKTRNNKDIRIEDGKVFIEGKEVVSGPGHPRVVVRSVDEKETGDGTRREEIRVQVVRAGDREITVPLAPIPPMPPVAGAPLPPVPPLPPMPGMQTMRFESTARLGKGVTTQMGAKEFDGVRAEGRSTVWTIPAGEIGNRSPIQVTSESWYSPDLKLTVYSRYHDPRTGESIYRLANIRRAEPARALFTIPEDYDAKGAKKEKEKEKDRK